MALVHLLFYILDIVYPLLTVMLQPMLWVLTFSESSAWRVNTSQDTIIWLCYFITLTPAAIVVQTGCKERIHLFFLVLFFYVKKSYKPEDPSYLHSRTGF